MRYVRFESRGKISFGVVEQEEVRVLDGSPLERCRETGARNVLSEVRLLPPAIPTKIVCIGLNYPEHIEEIGAKTPEEPHFFMKPPSCLIGPGEDIVIPKNAERVDFEGEMAVVIKNTMKDVPEAEALRYVLGYSCFNDVTERSIVFKNIADLTLAKGFDTFGAFGPYVATDLDPNGLSVRTYLNGQLMQQDNTRNCVFSVQYILHYLSQCMTLCPGDIVITGTPKGIAPMKSGDVVEVEMDGVGKLMNSVKLQA